MEQKLHTETNDMFITSHLGADSLPGFVQNCLNVAKTTPTKDMLLLSVLTNCAYALPAMRCYHGLPRHEYGPDLMTMVLAPAASGKGVMNYGRKLLMHAAATYDLLPVTSTPTPEAFSKSDAEHLANTLGVSVKTLNNWLTKWVQSSDLQHVAHGEYKKSA